MQPTIAYVSAEYAIADDLPIYAGGLGILAADTVRQAGDGTAPFWAVGLTYHQAFTGGDPDPRPMTERLEANGFSTAKDADGETVIVTVPVAGRHVRLQAWHQAWGPAHLLLLDSHLDGADSDDRAICDRLYPSDLALELSQQVCLGFGGLMMLERLGVRPDIIHMNEGHTAMAGLAYVVRLRAAGGTQAAGSQSQSFTDAVAQSRPQLVGTKHTILAGAGIQLDWQTTSGVVGSTLEAYGTTVDELKAIATTHRGDYSDTKLMLALAGRSSGVAKIHVAAEAAAHPGSPLVAITNGVYQRRWASGRLGGSGLALDDAALWNAHQAGRAELVQYVNEQTGSRLDPKRLTVVWARHMAAYKQPGLLVESAARLAELIHHAERPIQFIVAGRANPADPEGTALMRRVIETAARPELAGGFAYLPNYNPATARLLVQGADVWLNTPVVGYEACGTSGMKASLNGAVQLSTSDGWIDEVDIPAIGWRLPGNGTSADIYDVLERDIAPRFYDRPAIAGSADAASLPAAWVQLMRANVELIEQHFTTDRMLSEYYDILYRPGAAA